MFKLFYSLRNLLCDALTAFLRTVGRHRGKHQIMWEKPDARALVRHDAPVVKMKNFIRNSQTVPSVARTGADGKFISIRHDLNRAHAFFHTFGQTACIAGENKADAFRRACVRKGGGTAHHDDVGVTKRAGNVFCQIKAVSGAGVTINNSFTHGKNSFVYTAFIVAKTWQIGKKKAEKDKIFPCKCCCMNRVIVVSYNKFFISHAAVVPPQNRMKTA